MKPSEADRAKAREIMSGLPLYKWIECDLDADVVEGVTMTFAQAIADERERTLEAARAAILPRLRHLKEMADDTPVLDPAVEAASWFLRDLERLAKGGARESGLTATSEVVCASEPSVPTTHEREVGEKWENSAEAPTCECDALGEGPCPAHPNPDETVPARVGQASPSPEPDGPSDETVQETARQFTDIAEAIADDQEACEAIADASLASDTTGGWGAASACIADEIRARGQA